MGRNIELRHSKVHGTGAFALRGLQAGTRLGSYAGRRYPPGEAAPHHQDDALTYLFALADGSFIDGSDGGNALRFVNHSCRPNCRAVEVTAEDGDADIVFIACRRIRSGEELFIDYALAIGDRDPSAYRCRCGAAQCRGTMAMGKA